MQNEANNPLKWANFRHVERKSEVFFRSLKWVAFVEFQCLGIFHIFGLMRDLDEMEDYSGPEEKRNQIFFSYFLTYAHCGKTPFLVPKNQFQLLILSAVCLHFNANFSCLFTFISSEFFDKKSDFAIVCYVIMINLLEPDGELQSSCNLPHPLT